MPLLVYVASPFSALTEEAMVDNFGRACAAGKALLERGHVPLIPHLNIAYDMWHEGEFGVRCDPEMYMAWDFELVKRCDGLLFLGSSPGADREKALAEELGMPVWVSVEDVGR